MAKIKLFALVLSFFPAFTFAGAPITCLTPFTDLETFVGCLDKHTVPADFYDEARYTAAQPSASEIVAWNTAVQTLLSASSCPAGAVAGLPDYVFALVTESVGTKAWCILVESYTHPASVLAYKRGWGFVVTPADPVNGVIRDLHFSAPHPKSDENTPRQAAALFKGTGAKSLVVTGRNRKAYPISTACSKATPPGIYYKTDAAHDNNEPFYLALVQVAAWKNAHGGCPWACCAYLQIHGMDEDTCPEYVFMSSGRGNTTASALCYANPLLPIKRLKNQLLSIFPGSLIDTPSPSSSCILTATRNIFGRLVSGIPASDVCVNADTITASIPCTTGPTCSGTGGCMGPFVHIEQDPDFRLEINYGNWVNAITAAFPPRTLCTGTVLGENAFKVQA